MNAFDVAAQRVQARFHRRTGKSITVADLKRRWYAKGAPWIQRNRFGKAP